MVSSVVKDVLGAVGGGILSFCLLPQLWKVWRTRSATDLSMPFLVLYNTGALAASARPASYTVGLRHGGSQIPAQWLLACEHCAIAAVGLGLGAAPCGLQCLLSVWCVGPSLPSLSEDPATASKQYLSAAAGFLRGH